MSKSGRERTAAYRERQKKAGKPDTSRKNARIHSREYERRAKFKQEYGVELEEVPCTIEKP